MRAVAIAHILIALTACTSVSPKPFNDYASSVKNVGDAMIQALGASQSEARDTLIEEYANNPDVKFGDLKIKEEKGGFTWHFAADTPPVYLALKAASLRLAKLNEVFLQYTQLLSTLAGGDIKDADPFAQIATQLNANASKLTGDLGLGEVKPAAPILGVGVSEIFQQFISSRRKRDLKDALEKNQTSVQAYVDRCIDLVEILRSIVQSQYGEGYRVAQSQWLDASHKTSPSAVNQRKAIAVDVVNLNDHYIEEMAILQAIESALNALPDGHADLAKGLDASHGLLASTQQLIQSGQHLAQLYNQLKTNQGGNP